MLIALLGAVALSKAEPKWITFPDIESNVPVVLNFRRDIYLDRLAKSYPVEISADNRFIFYVNGKRIADGPSRGDLRHWKYRELDLKPFLRRGKNTIAAKVWNSFTGQSPPSAPLAQISARTGFWLRGAGQASVFETGANWRVARDNSRRFESPWPHLNIALGGTYYVAGSSEIVDASKADRNWNSATGSTSKWVEAVPALRPGEIAPWTMVADQLPQMKYHPTQFGRVVRTDLAEAKTFPARAVTVAANSSASILIDQGTMISGYPSYKLSGGTGAKVKFTYSEALYDTNGKKSDRNLIDNRVIVGVEDSFLPNGQKDQVFQPLWWRTWRFLQVSIETGDQPLTLNRPSLYQTGYPFKERGAFKSDDPALNEIWEIGWRTLGVNSHETFMDSSYWEQLQYVGDTRIESLIATTISGDSRLPAQAIDAFGNSQSKDGMIQSAYPSSGDNIIPPFGLLWLGMMHDYAKYYRDIEVITRNIDGGRRVLDWYLPYVAENGLVKITPYWNYIDWAGDAQRPGEPTVESRFPSFDQKTKTSCIVSLSYLGALKDMAALEMVAGDPSLARNDQQQAEKLSKAIQDECWDARRGLYADSPDRSAFSQHANALAVLYDVAPQDQKTAILRNITKGHGVDAPDGIIEASYYFSWYIVRAFDHANLDEYYLDLAETWRDLLKLNFTTWPETRGDTRSDTHAWSAHPTADLINIVAGIRPDSVGFRSAVIAPQLGTLKAVDATMPTPDGDISVSYRVSENKMRAKIIVPKGLPSTFIWRGKRYELRSGINRMNITSP